MYVYCLLDDSYTCVKEGMHMGKMNEFISSIWRTSNPAGFKIQGGLQRLWCRYVIGCCGCEVTVTFVVDINAAKPYAGGFYYNNNC